MFSHEEYCGIKQGLKNRLPTNWTPDINIGNKAGMENKNNRSRDGALDDL
jgi:hypothetical protein